MNSNLKRVLSIALMSAMLAANFMIPALAADYTINYNDLPTSLKNQQNVLYYETTPNGLDSTVNNKSEYSPLDVWKQANRPSVNMTKSEWIRYEADVAEAGYYQVNLFMGVQAQGGADIVVRTDSNITETHLKKSSTQELYNSKVAVDMGYLYLNEGANYIYVENRDPVGQVNFNKIELTKDDTADETFVKALNLVTTCTEAETATFTTAEGYTTTELTGGTITCPISVAQDGKYRLYLHGKTETGSSATISVGETSKEVTIAKTEKKPVDKTYLTYDNTDGLIFPLTAGDYNLSVSGLEDYKLAWAVVEYVAPYETAVESSSFENGATVMRGTDKLVLTFNDTMDALIGGTATIEGEDGTVPADVIVDGKDVTVSFLETLNYGETYTVTVSGLKCINDEAGLEDVSYTFTAGSEGEEDAAEETFTEVDASADGELVTVTGTLLGSTGKGIKGRTVSVGNTGGTVATGTSGKDGKFTVTFNIPLGTLAGKYDYTVVSEYGTETPISVNYVSAEEKLKILGLFKAATDADDVATIFDGEADDNYNLLGVFNYPEEIAALKDNSNFAETAPEYFHNHFVGKEFTDLNKFKTYYNKMLLMEQMNNAKKGSYIKSNFFTKPEVLKVLFSEGLVKKIQTMNYKNIVGVDLAEDVISKAAPVTTEEAFVKFVEETVDARLKAENGITDTQLKITGIPASVYVNGAVTLPMAFTEEQTKLTAVKVTLQLDSDFVDSRKLEDIVNTASDKGVTAEWKNKDDAVVLYTFPFDKDSYITKIGEMSFNAPEDSASGCAFTIKGIDLVYAIGETELIVGPSKTYLLNDDNEELAGIKIDVLTTPDGGSGGGGGGGGGGGIGAPQPPKEKEKEDDTTGSLATTYFFDDMKDAIWAQDMVHTLVGKGVISTNAQRAFRPSDNVTREEVGKMLVTVVGAHDANATSDLTDVASNHWATSYIATAQQLGIVKGNADGSFGLGTNITRQDMAVMIYRTFAMLGIDLPAGNTAFDDAGDIANYAQDAVSALEKQGVINGMGDGTFAPRANATRAQAAKVIYVMMEVLGIL